MLIFEEDPCLFNYRLNNGLRIVSEPISNTRSVAFGIWIKTGSRHENHMNNGISHLIEHMLFKGTSRHTAKEIAEIFDGIGGNVNAFTSKEFTCYYAKVLDEHLPIAMEVLSEMFFQSAFREQDLEKEKNVIYEEIFMYEDTPDDLVHELVSKAAFGSHTLGFPVLGIKENLERLTSQDLHTHMKNNYFIENTVISLSGNIKDTTHQLIEKYFSQFLNHGKSPGLTQPIFSSELIFVEKKTEQNHICLTWPGLSYQEEELYTIVLLNNLIGGGMSSRLFQEIREKRGLAYSVYSYHSSQMDTGLLTFYIGSAPKHTQEVFDATLNLVNELLIFGITDAELNKNKEQLKGSLILSLESSSSRMNRNGKNELILEKHEGIDEIINKIEKINKDQIHELAQKIFRKPFALSMVGNNDHIISAIRRDQLVK